MDTIGRLRYLEHLLRIPERSTARWPAAGSTSSPTAPSPTSWVATMSCGLRLADPGRLGPLLPRRAASSWPSTASNPMSATRFSGSCATASQPRSSWPRALWSSTAKDLAAALIDQVPEGPAGARSPAPSPTAGEHPQGRGQRRSKVSRISSAIFSISAKRPGRSPRRTATPKKELKEQVRGIRKIERGGGGRRREARRTRRRR